MADKRRVTFVRRFLSPFLAVAILGGIVYAGANFGNKPIVAANSPTGDVKRVIVEFKGVNPVGLRGNIDAQQKEITEAGDEIMNKTPYQTGYKKLVKSYDNLPLAIYDVDVEGEKSLRSNPGIASVSDDEYLESAMDSVLSTIGGGVTTDFTDVDGSYDGVGTTIAVLDNGFRTSHVTLEGKIIAEACFSSNGTGYSSLCVGGAESDTNTGASSASCDRVDVDVCSHGTSVASVAVGSEATHVGGDWSGVAKGASLIPIQVFSVFDAGVGNCDVANPCLGALESDVAAAIDHIISLQNSGDLDKPISAANLSLASGAYDDQALCEADLPLYTVAFSALRANNIAPIVATGNGGATAGEEGSISRPACVAGAIAVSATDVTGSRLASYAQNGALTTILAPGGATADGGGIIVAGSDTDSSFRTIQGTSAAAPVVSGAFAILRQKHPNATIDQLIDLMQSSGVDVVDARDGYNGIVKRRLDLGAALRQSPYPVISSFMGPSAAVANGQNMILSGSVQNATSCSLDNSIGGVTLASGAFTKSVPVADSYTLSCRNIYNDTVQQTESFTINFSSPVAPAEVNSTYDQDSGSATITWREATDPDGIREYQISLNGTHVATVDGSTLSYTFTKLSPDTDYTAEVLAVDMLGGVSGSASVQFSTERLLVPPNTGVLGVSSSARALTVAILGTALALITLVFTRRYANR